MPSKFYDPIEYHEKFLDHQEKFEEGFRVANILDPIHDTLSPEVFDDPAGSLPKLKEAHRKWIHATVVSALKGAGYTHVDDWLTLILTGSLTTYQYDRGSDVDVSLFVDAEHFPEWSRAEMIGVMITKVDGRKLPGTPYPMQCFVVPPDVKQSDLYKPGLRSGYNLKTQEWITPPEKDRVMDVQSQLPGFYAYALEQADKMESLLCYEPEKAKSFWHQIHERRRRDQKKGKGDYASSNIVYKFLANRGLFPAIADATGEYIASRRDEAPRFTPIDPDLLRHRVDPRAIAVAANHMGINGRVVAAQVGGVAGGYHGPDDSGTHRISVVGWLSPERASAQLWHELAHAKQYEDGERFGVGYHDAYEQGHDAYTSHPSEVDARKWATRNPFPLALPVAKESKVAFDHKQVAKFVYDPIENKLVVGRMGDEEGEVESHYDLARMSGINLENKPLWGQVAANGYAETFGRPMIQGFGQGGMNQYEAQWRLVEALRKAIPGVRFTNEQKLLTPKWLDNYTEPQIQYIGDKPQVQPQEQGFGQPEQDYTFG